MIALLFRIIHKSLKVASTCIIRPCLTILSATIFILVYAATPVSGQPTSIVSFSGSSLGSAAIASTPSATSPAAITDEPDEPVRIGIRVVPPFVIDEGDGRYSGLTIELWEHIADQLEIDYLYEEHDIQGLLDGVSSAPDRPAPPLFASASALTITAEREEHVDFTHPFFVTGLGIAVSYKPAGFLQALGGIFTADFLWVVFLLILLLLFWGSLLWYFERRANEDEFGGSPAEGIGSGFWWAAVTMTTVGYGDKSPKTFWGRSVGFLWMFAGIILISFFTASIASSLTVSQLDSRVSGPRDLPYVRAGVLENSATGNWFEEQRIRSIAYPTIADGLRAVENDEIDAFVHDAPIIRYYATRDFANRVRVLPGTFNEQYYGIALPFGSPYRNDINRVMLEYITDDEWLELQRRYLGE